MPSWKSIFRGQSRLPPPEHVPDMEEPTTNGSVADRTGNRPGDRPSTGAGMGSPLQKPGLPFDGRTIGVCLLLFAVVFWVFAPATRNGFIDWDDGLFVTENPQVRSGLTWGGLLWAFCNPVAANWHPLTVLSHMLDCEAYGVQPWGHHLTSILIHAANTVLVFLVFLRMTGAFWRCAVLAALFGLWVLYFWQVGVMLFDVPRVLLPAPSLIGRMLVERWDTLAGDFVQTVLKAVLIGWALGSGLGFAVGVAIDRAPFLQRGLLPLANLTSTVPLVAVAPIAVMWFGFDWQSKAAVVVLMTFFPMLVATLAGLQAAGKLERELMHSYAAGYTRTLLDLRLPAAMPFLFSALKINATLALIGAIVAEFFGSPTVGLGFRISTEAARMNMALVWGAIVVAAVTGSLAYALLVLLERRVAFWHPSIRAE